VSSGALWAEVAGTLALLTGELINMDRKSTLASLQSIFPNFDREVLTAVLEAEQYNLELTIEALFAMNTEPVPVGSSLADDNYQASAQSEPQLPDVQLDEDFLELEHSASSESVDEMMAAYLQMREMDHAQGREDLDEAIWQSIQESRKKQKKPPLGTRFKDKLKSFFSRKSTPKPDKVVKRQQSQAEERKQAQLDLEEERKDAERLDDDVELISFEHSNSTPTPVGQRYHDPFEEQQRILEFTQARSSK
jgi:hypothetical protein